MGDENHLEGR